MALGSYNYTIWPFSSQLGLRPQRQGSYPTATPCCCCCSPQASLSPVVNSTLSEIRSSGVIACLRAQSAELAMEAACAALRGGISVVGTVLNAKDAKSAVNAGAKFLMSPAMVKDILDDAQGSEALYIPGVMTPTEILSAHGAGAKIVKVYPVSILGGVRYISALRKPFSHISMIASQGITIDLIGDYIAQGASSVVLSDAIFEKEAMDHRRFNLIHQLSQLAVLRVNEAVQRSPLAFSSLNTVKAQVEKTTIQASPTRPLLYRETKHTYIRILLRRISALSYEVAQLGINKVTGNVSISFGGRSIIIQVTLTGSKVLDTMHWKIDEREKGELTVRRS
ncbi:uncharacterized protein LOC131330586 isoform X3 [Rhododendron vialii]|uniref:uncharacterized protein LOC131330586 isoform X3 n=1 Tax=Rhododendron vialii TaxID=182163 RepID=UPI0026601EDB|nr:uncharacterized protein LOC131330586 isoform X3 [Rhododendron vialii]